MIVSYVPPFFHQVLDSSVGLYSSQIFHLYRLSTLLPHDDSIFYFFKGFLVFSTPVIPLFTVGRKILTLPLFFGLRITP